MLARAQTIPGQPHALSGHVTCARRHVTHVRRHVLLLSGFHPCSVSHGTGKLNINIIYSKCHKCKVESGLVVVFIYDFWDELSNFRLWKLFINFLAFSDSFRRLFWMNFQCQDMTRFSQYRNNVTNVIRRTICHKTCTVLDSIFVVYADFCN